MWTSEVYGHHDKMARTKSHGLDIRLNWNCSHPMFLILQLCQKKIFSQGSPGTLICFVNLYIPITNH